MGALSIWHWLILLVVVALVFGTSKLKNVGKDLGGAIKGFKEGMKEVGDDEKNPESVSQRTADPQTIDVQAKEKSDRT